MIKRHDIQVAIKQAQKASLALRAAILSKDAPSVETINALLEDGAQVDWMTSKGTWQSENAIYLAAQRGLHEIIEPLVAAGGPLPSPKGKTVFPSPLLGTKYLPLLDYEKTVHALLRSGYKWEDDAVLKCSAIDISINSGSFEYLKILVDAGAWGSHVSNGHSKDVMAYAMKMETPDVMEYLLEKSPPERRHFLQSIWWQLANKHCNASTFDEAARIGQSVAPLTDEALLGLQYTSKIDLAAYALKYGYVPNQMGHQERYFDGSPLQPVWRCEGYEDLVEAAAIFGAPLDKLNLSTSDSQNGRDWFQHSVSERSVLGEYSSLLNSGKLMKVLTRLKDEGFWDPGHQDNSGSTVGLYIANRIGAMPSKEQRQKCWDIIEKFDLLQYQVKLENGVEVPAFRHLQGKPFNVPDRDWLSKENAKWESRALKENTPFKAKVSMPRRM